MADDFSILNAKAHRHLLRHAKNFKGQLYPILRAAGAVEMPNKKRGSLIFTLARAIVGQQVAAKVAAVFWQRIINAANKQNIADFLTPKNKTEIRACGVSNNKVRFLLGLGEAHRNGLLSARRVMALEHKERIEYLTKLDGVGVWTADIVGIFYCRDADIWPQGDLAVRRTFANLIGVSEDETLKKAEPFAPFRTFLALHMWNEKNNPMVRV